MDDSTNTTDVKTDTAPPAPAIPLSKVITPEKKAFLAALAKAQGQYKPIEKNQVANIRPRDASKQPYSFKYADLDAILDGTREALSSNGISTRVLLTDHDGDTIWLNSVVAHSEGWEDVSSIRVNTVADDVKTFGGRITFMRRYLLGPQIGVAATDDTDQDGVEPGEGQAMGDVMKGAKVTPAKPTPARKPAAAPPAKADEPPDDGAPPIGELAAKPPEPAPPPKVAPSVNEAELARQTESINRQMAANGLKIVGEQTAALSPAPEPAPTPRAAPAPSGNDKACTPGEILYIQKRIKACGIAIRPTLDDLGYQNVPDDLTGLTKTQWGELLKVTTPR